MKDRLDRLPRLSRRASHSSVVTSVAFSPDSALLASGSWDGTIKLWDLSSPSLTPVRTLRGNWDEVEAVAFAPDGKIAGLGTGWDDAPFGAVTVWEPGATRGRLLVRSEGKLDAIAFSPDGTLLATASADSNTVDLWEVSTGFLRASLTEHRGPVWSVAFSPDGTTLAAASGTVPTVAESSGDTPLGAIRLWDLRSSQPTCLTDLMGHQCGIVSLAFSPVGKTLASGGFDRMVKLWDTDSRQERAMLEGHGAWVAAVAFSPDGSMLATGSHDHTIRVWDVASARELAKLDGHTGNVYSVAFSPDGAYLASGSLDGSVKLWEVGPPPDSEPAPQSQRARSQSRSRSARPSTA